MTISHALTATVAVWMSVLGIGSFVAIAELGKIAQIQYGFKSLADLEAACAALDGSGESRYYYPKTGFLVILSALVGVTMVVASIAVCCAGCKSRPEEPQLLAPAPKYATLE